MIFVEERSAELPETLRLACDASTITYAQTATAEMPIPDFSGKRAENQRPVSLGYFITSKEARNYASKYKNMHYINNLEGGGWGGRIRTYGTRYQKPLPYRLATPQRAPVTRTMYGDVQVPFFTNIEVADVLRWLSADFVFLAFQRVVSIKTAPSRFPASTVSCACAVSARGYFLATGHESALSTSDLCKRSIAWARLSSWRI